MMRTLRLSDPFAVFFIGYSIAVSMPPLQFQADECAHTDGHHEPKAELNSSDSGHADLLLPIYKQDGRRRQRLPVS